MEAEAWERVDAALDGAPPMQRLPGSVNRRATPRSGRFLAVGLLRQLAYMAEEGSDSAEILLLFAPTLFFAKGSPIDDQIRAFIGGTKLVSEHKVAAPTAAWVASLEDALSCGSLRKASQILDAGPRDGPVRVTAEIVQEFFPPVRDGEVEIFAEQAPNTLGKSFHGR